MNQNCNFQSCVEFFKCKNLCWDNRPLIILAINWTLVISFLSFVLWICSYLCSRPYWCALWNIVNIITLWMINAEQAILLTLLYLSIRPYCFFIVGFNFCRLHLLSAFTLVGLNFCRLVRIVKIKTFWISCISSAGRWNEDIVASCLLS